MRMESYCHVMNPGHGDRGPGTGDQKRCRVRALLLLPVPGPWSLAPLLLLPVPGPWSLVPLLLLPVPDFDARYVA
jgi:hypothetical protein